MAAHRHLYQVSSLLDAKAPCFGGPKIIETKHPGALFHCLSIPPAFTFLFIFTFVLPL